LNKEQILTKKNKSAETPLFNVCMDGNEEIVRYLVEQEVDIKKKK